MEGAFEQAVLEESLWLWALSLNWMKDSCSARNTKDSKYLKGEASWTAGIGTKMICSTAAKPGDIVGGETFSG